MSSDLPGAGMSREELSQHIEGDGRANHQRPPVDPQATVQDLLQIHATLHRAGGCDHVHDFTQKRREWGLPPR